MPVYVYRCNQCESSYDNITDFTSSVMFETYHSMNPSKDELVSATKCPRCGSIDCCKAYDMMPNRSFIRGYGFKDRDGLSRDMHKQKLISEDPYSAHRVPGESDHIYSELVNAGQHKPNKQYFTATDSKSGAGDSPKQ